MPGRLFSFRPIFNRDGYIVRRSTEAGEQTDSDIFQKNERIRWRSNVAIAIGTGFFLAAAVRYGDHGADWYTIFWLVVGLVIMWASQYVLSLLEAER